MGKRTTEEVKERTLLCDVFCGYSAESGDAQRHTFVVDLGDVPRQELRSFGLPPLPAPSLTYWNAKRSRF